MPVITEILGLAAGLVTLFFVARFANIKLSKFEHEEAMREHKSEHNQKEMEKK